MLLDKIWPKLLIAILLPFILLAIILLSITPESGYSGSEGEAIRSCQRFIRISYPTADFVTERAMRISNLPKNYIYVFGYTQSSLPYECILYFDDNWIIAEANLGLLHYE